MSEKSRHLRNSTWFLALWAVAAMPAAAQAAEIAINGKRVIALEPVENIRIEMPDGSLYGIGPEFEAVITRHLLESGKYIVASEPTPHEFLPDGTRSFGARSVVWPGTHVPAATVSIQPEAVAFYTGSRGDRTFYGFHESYRTPYNDGSGQGLNEFGGGRAWFEPFFDRTGKGITHSQAGLDLGDGFGLNVLFAFLNVKYALYRAELRFRLEMRAPLAGRFEFRRVEVIGKGFFFDISGGYLQYGGAIGISRTDAMAQAVRRALRGAIGRIDEGIQDLPLTGRVDGILSDGRYLLGTGLESGVLPGVEYVVLDAPGARIRILESVRDGSIGELIAGEPEAVQPGMLIREASFVPPKAAIASLVAPESEQVELPWTDLEKPDLGEAGPQDDIWKATLRSIAENAVLPYRIWRYFQYDQERAERPEKHTKLGMMEASPREWARIAGIAPVPPGVPAKATRVAVIDSGVDYNHPAIHRSVLSAGKDLISDDARAYDDGYHGTQVASALLAVDPDAKILPLKAFNPFGITTSAAIAAAFNAAIEARVDLIVCAWATPRYSRALYEGIARAREHGILVIAAAGDHGQDLARAPEYPASFATELDNLLTVAELGGSNSNFGPGVVALAAPGENVTVALPRHRKTVVSSSGIAAAIAAGALSRHLAECGDPALAQFLAQRSLPARELEGRVTGGRRLLLTPRVPTAAACK